MIKIISIQQTQLRYRTHHKACSGKGNVWNPCKHLCWSLCSSDHGRKLFFLDKKVFYLIEIETFSFPFCTSLSIGLSETLIFSAACDNEAALLVKGCHHLSSYFINSFLQTDTRRVINHSRVLAEDCIVNVKADRKL